MALLSEADVGPHSPDFLVPELSSLEKGAGHYRNWTPTSASQGAKEQAHFLEFSTFLMLVRTYWLSGSHPW